MKTYGVATHKKRLMEKIKKYLMWIIRLAGPLYNYLDITKTRLYRYIAKFTSKNLKFSIKDSDIFHISAQNLDCGYSLEPPRRGSSNVYPQFMILSKNKKNNVYPCFTI